MPKEPEWNMVKTSDYYGEFEAAGDMPIKHGMRIQVRWPDGTVTKEKLVVVSGSGSAQVDMNNYPDHFPTQRLKVRHDIHGALVLIPLNGLRIGVDPA